MDNNYLIELISVNSATTKLVEVHLEDKPKVALIRPPVVFPARAVGNEATPSIGLAYLRGYLRKHGYDPILIDGMALALNRIWKLEKYPGFYVQGLRFEEIIQKIPRGTSIIGINAMFSGEWPAVRDLITEVRKNFPNALLVAGGEHVTALTDYCLQDCPALDVIVRGEGEHTFFEVCEAFCHGDGFAAIKGAAFRNKDGIIVVNELVRIKNADVIPAPFWQVENLEKYWKHGKSFGPQTKRDMPMMVSRGCPYRCAFCSSDQMWTNRYVLRSIDEVMKELKDYIQHFDVTGIQLYDLTAITKKAWILEFLHRLKKEKINVKWAFSSGTRSEALDEEVLTLLKEVGTNYICYAPESASERMLEMLRKKIDLKKMDRSIKTALKIGLIVRVNIIIGFPRERRRDTYKTLVYALKYVMKGVEDIQPYIYMPYPGSELFRQLLAEQKITLGDNYFFSLSGLNSDLTNFKPLTFNEKMFPWELAFYRLLFTLMAYSISYLFYPKRIIRTIRNLLSDDNAATVFEARVKGVLRRKKEKMVNSYG
ncbi:MAG: radical SAM protein [Oligoflexia bacterium]|nr:radical SAM protein [Oligoflexia bacterium]